MKVLLPAPVTPITAMYTWRRSVEGSGGILRSISTQRAILEAKRRRKLEDRKNTWRSMSIEQPSVVQHDRQPIVFPRPALSTATHSQPDQPALWAALRQRVTPLKLSVIFELHDATAAGIVRGFEIGAAWQ